MRSPIPPGSIVPLVLAASLSHAQETLHGPTGPAPVYKCDGRTYTQVPCGRLLGGPRVSATYGAAPPPQDRARRMARAQLPPEVRERCAVLEADILREEARQRATVPTEDEKGDLAIQRVHYRELRC